MQKLDAMKRCKSIISDYEENIATATSESAEYETEFAAFRSTNTFEDDLKYVQSNFTSFREAMRAREEAEDRGYVAYNEWPAEKVRIETLKLQYAQALCNLQVELEIEEEEPVIG